MLSEVLINLEKYIKSKKKQNINEGSYYRRRCAEDSFIDWSLKSNVEVYNLIRGMYGPYQWAFSFLDDRKIEFKPVKLVNLRHKEKEEPGKVSVILRKGVVINCCKNAILVNEIKINNQIIKAKNFFNQNDYLINNNYLGYKEARSKNE